MTAKQIIRMAMAEKRISQGQLAEMCGMKSQSNINGILNRGTSLRVDSFEQLISAMGYEIVVRKTDEKTCEMVVHEERAAKE